MRESEDIRKARGAFFTPPELASFLASWAIRSGGERVLDPSCGEAALLVAAGLELRRQSKSGLLRGIDIHGPSIRAARRELRKTEIPFELRLGGFFETEPIPEWDVVIGNPPYVRYQAFTGAARLKAQEAALKQGVRLGGLANAWAAFVVHASQFLKPAGRLALVLPAVLLSVNYAAQVRRFLLRRFASVQIIAFEERVFPGVMEEVVLLLAQGQGPTDRFELFQVRDLDGLLSLKDKGREYSPETAGAKWTDALLPDASTRLYRSLLKASRFEGLAEWGDTILGMVTGNNDYFTMSAEDARKRGIEGEELLRISPPGSRHLRGLELSEATFQALEKDGARTYLFYPGERPSPHAQRYIEHGEKLGVHRAYKCSVRTPWWRVPLVAAPDLYFTSMNRDLPRLVTNEAKVRCLNSVHAVQLKSGRTRLGRELLPIAMLNSLTALGAELEGRSYGGGILKMEPKEADLLPVPDLDLVEAAAAGLRAIQPTLGRELRGQQLDQAVEAVDAILLAGQLGLGRSEIEQLRHGRRVLASRRESRSGKHV